MSFYDDASLIMFPSGYKEDKIYSLKPTDGSGDLTFTRASTATRVNAEGLIETSPVNLLQYSEEFNNAVYNKYNNITATADQTTAPNGTTTADKIGLSTASTTFPNLGQDISFINGQVYTFSVYLKKNTINFGKIRLGGTAFASSTNSPLFNLNTGVIVSGTGTIESVGNGWYRCTMTATAEANAVGGFAIDLPDSAGVWNGSSVYNVNDSIFAWGYQANIGSTAKPYFPTTDRLNVPRIDYTGGNCGKLLLEPQRTNLALYSEQFDNASWGKDEISVTANTATSPDNTVSADKIIPSTSASGHHLTETVTGAAHSFSVFAKAGGYSTLNILYTVHNAYATFNLSAGTITETNGTATAKIENYGNGWYRCTVSTSSTTHTEVRIYAINGTTFADVNTAGNGSDGILVWGAQLEVGTYPTSYIPTLASSVTRLADAAQKTGISSLIGQTEGTMFAEFTYNGVANSGVYEVILVIGTNTSNLIALNKNNTTSELYAYAINGGVIQVNSVGIADTNIIGTHKVALAYKLNDYAVYLDGVQVFTDTSASVPTCSSVYVGQSEISTQQLGGTINQALLFPTRLTNTQLAELTTI